MWCQPRRNMRIMGPLKRGILAIYVSPLVHMICANLHLAYRLSRSIDALACWPVAVKVPVPSRQLVLHG